MAQQRVGVRNGALFNPTSTLWNNLLAYYTADGTPNDALGNYNGTLVNGTTYGTGKINQGFSFDGVNDYVNLGNNLDFNGSTPFSISFWFYATNASGFRTPLGKVKGTTPINGYYFVYYLNKIRFVLSNDATTNWLSVENSATLSNSTWYHCTMTYDGSKSSSGLKVYINNALNTQTIINDTLTGTISNIYNFNIGARSNTQFFTGLVDEVGVWNRVLTPTEVTELYNSGTGKQYPN